MDTAELRDVPRMIFTLLSAPRVKRVTKYTGPRETIKVTRKGRVDARDRHHEFMVTVGPPNFAERRFIKLCRKAGEPFPVKKLQIYAPRQSAK